MAAIRAKVGREIYRGKRTSGTRKNFRKIVIEKKGGQNDSRDQR
jgi:hypothetical protein